MELKRQITGMKLPDWQGWRGWCAERKERYPSGFEIPHGQAVVLGMGLANIVARNRGLLSDTLASFVFKNLLLPSLIIRPKEKFLRADPVIAAMKKDKKRTGDALALIMLADGYSFIKAADVTAAEADEALMGLKKAL